VGLRLLELSALAPRGLELREAAFPHLEDLHQVTRGNVHLGVRDGREVVYIEAIRAHVPNPLSSRVGDRWPMHATTPAHQLADQPVRRRQREPGPPRDLAQRQVAVTWPERVQHRQHPARRGRPRLLRCAGPRAALGASWIVSGVTVTGTSVGRLPARAGWAGRVTRRAGDQPLPDGDERRLRAGGQLQFREHVADVRAGGAFADVELGGDLAVREPAGHQPEDGAFPCGQRRDAGGRGHEVVDGAPAGAGGSASASGRQAVRSASCSAAASTR
jgi:hypothetical protein